MNQTHVHLLITHLPIIGSALGAFVLIHGIWRKSNSTLIAAYNILILSAIGASIAYLTGEGAEETVEQIKGISENLIEEHAESALSSLIVLIVTGVVAIVGLFATLRSSSMTRLIAFLTLAASLVGFGLIARTGYLGGQIRHTEIGSTTSSPAQQRTDTNDD